METFFSVLSTAADIAGGVILVVCALLWRRHHATVRVVLSCGDTSKEVPLCLTRDQVTRAEVMGRLGAVASVPRLSVAYLGTPEFFKAINEVVSGKTDTLVIKVTEKELEQF